MALTGTLLILLGRRQKSNTKHNITIWSKHNSFSSLFSVPQASKFTDMSIILSTSVKLPWKVRFYSLKKKNHSLSQFLFLKFQVLYKIVTTIFLKYIVKAKGTYPCKKNFLYLEDFIHFIKLYTWQIYSWR